MPEAKQVRPFYKYAGANFSQQNQIKAYAEEGFTAQEISQKMGIVPSCVESFMPKKAAKKKAPAKKPAPKAEAESWE